MPKNIEIKVRIDSIDTDRLVQGAYVDLLNTMSG